MSAETILKNAAAAEGRTRAMARVVQQAAELQPDQETLQVIAETTHIMLDVAQKRANLISRQTVEAHLAGLKERTEELEEQLVDGSRSLADALSNLDQLQAGTALLVPQHKLDAWEAAENEMRSLMIRAGLQDGA